jgi:hypothetical protein
MTNYDPPAVAIEITISVDGRDRKRVANPVFNWLRR